MFEVGEGSGHLAQAFVGVAHVASGSFSPPFHPLSLVGRVEAVEKLVKVPGKSCEFQYGAMEAVVRRAASRDLYGVEKGVQFGDVNVGSGEVVGVVV